MMPQPRYSLLAMYTSSCNRAA